MDDTSPPRTYFPFLLVAEFPKVPHKCLTAPQIKRTSLLSSQFPNTPSFSFSPEALWTQSVIFPAPFLFCFCLPLIGFTSSQWLPGSLLFFFRLPLLPPPLGRPLTPQFFFNPGLFFFCSSLFFLYTKGPHQSMFFFFFAGAPHLFHSSFFASSGLNDKVFSLKTTFFCFFSLLFAPAECFCLFPPFLYGVQTSAFLFFLQPPLEQGVFFSFARPTTFSFF